MGWRVRGIRGATTVEANTYEALERAVLELMEEIEKYLAGYRIRNIR